MILRHPRQRRRNRREERHRYSGDFSPGITQRILLRHRKARASFWFMPFAGRSHFGRCAVVVRNATLGTTESHEMGRGERHARYRTSCEIGTQKRETSRRVTGFLQTKTGRRDETSLRPSVATEPLQDLPTYSVITVSSDCRGSISPSTRPDPETRSHRLLPILRSAVLASAPLIGIRTHGTLHDLSMLKREFPPPLESVFAARTGDPIGNFLSVNYFSCSMSALIVTRSCFCESRSRIVTVSFSPCAASSPMVPKSTVTHFGVPISS